MKHTKGEWDYYEIGLVYAPNGISVISEIPNKRRQLVCRMPIEDISVFADKKRIERIKADAKLIAAAPELLEALKGSLQILEQTLNYRNANKITGGNVFLTTAIELSKEAIKKAIS